VRALLRFDTLVSRHWLEDAARCGLVWSEVPAPLDLDQTERALAAGVVEMMAARFGQPTPILDGKCPLRRNHAAPEGDL